MRFLECVPHDEWQGLLDLRRRAREGDFFSYWDLNGYVADSVADCPVPLRRYAVQYEVAQNLMADMLCKYCGRWHGQFISAMVPGEGRVLPATCPHCGKEDAAGPLHHAEFGGKRYGKTEITFGLAAPFRIGWIGLHKRRPRGVCIAANTEEAEERVGIVQAALRRPMHEFVFGPDTVPLGGFGEEEGSGRGSTKSEIFCRRWGPHGRAVYRGYGVTAVPSGLHVDFVDWDDASNLNTELLKPAEGRKVRTKFYSTVDQGTHPWTAVNVMGNICAAGGLNEELLKMAKGDPVGWSVHTASAGDDKSEPPFKSYCPELVPPDWLRSFWERNPREYRRVFQLKAFMAGDLAFKQIQFWLAGPRLARRFDVPEMTPAQEKVAQAMGVPVLDDLEGWHLLPAADLAFTPDGPHARTRGRTQTAMGVLARDPTGPLVVLLEGASEYMGPEDHVPRIVEMCRRWNSVEAAIEITAAMVEIVAPLEREGLTIHVYNPSDPRLGGSKVARKDPLVAAANRGDFRLLGQFRSTRSNEIVPAESQRHVYEDMGLFPAQSSDSVDMVEIGWRKIGELYGLWADEEPAVVEMEQYADHGLARWRRAYQTPDGQPKSGDAVQDELDEHFPAGVMEAAFVN